MKLCCHTLPQYTGIGTITIIFKKRKYYVNTTHNNMVNNPAAEADTPSYDESILAKSSARRKVSVCEFRIVCNRSAGGSDQK